MESRRSVPKVTQSLHSFSCLLFGASKILRNWESTLICIFSEFLWAVRTKHHCFFLISFKARMLNLDGCVISWLLMNSRLTFCHLQRSKRSQRSKKSKDFRVKLSWVDKNSNERRMLFPFSPSENRDLKVPRRLFRQPTAKAGWFTNSRLVRCR